MEHFAKAPVHEALLDIQVVLPPNPDNLDFKLFGRGLEDRFPDRKERLQFVQNLQLAADQQQAPPIRSIEGYLFTSTKDGKIVQARRDGFTFNKLRPYSKWDDFSAEGRELWQRFVGFAHPVAVKRLGLRYINRIEIPENLTDLRDLCLLFPDVPMGVPQAWSEFFQRFATIREDGSPSIVTLAIDIPTPPNQPAIILDIDVVCHLQNSEVAANAIWPHFERMRVLKNEIFDASLTSRAKDMFR